MSTSDFEFDGQRTANTTAFHQTLILIFTALFLGGSGGGSGDEELWAIVADVVREEPRRARAIEVAGQLQTSQAQAVAHVVDMRLEVYTVLGDPDTTPGEVALAFEEALETVEAEERGRLDLRFELVEATTPEEWAAIRARLP